MISPMFDEGQSLLSSDGLDGPEFLETLKSRGRILCIFPPIAFRCETRDIRPGGTKDTGAPRL